MGKKRVGTRGEGVSMAFEWWLVPPTAPTFLLYLAHQLMRLERSKNGSIRHKICNRLGVFSSFSSWPKMFSSFRRFLPLLFSPSNSFIVLNFQLFIFSSFYLFLPSLTSSFSSFFPYSSSIRSLLLPSSLSSAGAASTLQPPRRYHPPCGRKIYTGEQAKSVRA